MRSLLSHGGECSLGGRRSPPSHSSHAEWLNDGTVPIIIQIIPSTKRMMTRSSHRWGAHRRNGRTPAALATMRRNHHTHVYLNNFLPASPSSWGRIHAYRSKRTELLITSRTATTTSNTVQ